VFDAYGSWLAEASLEGSTFRLGSYSSCLSIEKEDFQGQYCEVVHKWKDIEEEEGQALASPLFSNKTFQVRK